KESYQKFCNYLCMAMWIMALLCHSNMHGSSLFKEMIWLDAPNLIALAKYLIKRVFFIILFNITIYSSNSNYNLILLLYFKYFLYSIRNTLILIFISIFLFYFNF